MSLVSEFGLSAQAAKVYAANWRPFRHGEDVVRGELEERAPDGLGGGVQPFQWRDGEKAPKHCQDFSEEKEIHRDG